MSDQFSLQLNWRSGELTFLYGPSVDLYLGTPRVFSMSGEAGGVLTWGASRNEGLKGLSAYAGAVGQIDAVAELGLKATQSNSLIIADTNANGKEEFAGFVDPVSGKQVRSLQVGVSGGVNSAPNGVELGAVGGAGYTFGFNVATGWKVVSPVVLFVQLVSAVIPQ